MKTLTVKSVDEIQLPNMLGIMAKATVAKYGEYKCLVGGEKTLIKLERNGDA